MSDNGTSADELLCRYTPYPWYYEVDLLPPNGPTVVQVNAAPAGDQGLSASYSSGFSFSIGGDVNVSGTGPSGGIQVGATWNNEVSTTVPPLVIQAGDKGNQGTFTQYMYCTTGSSPEDCVSSIQMTNPQGEICQNYVVGEPQQGQTPNGRLSNVAQTVNWQVDPGTYGGATTFDITVTWQVNSLFSQAQLWYGQFVNLNTSNASVAGGLPGGYCNAFGCSCAMDWLNTLDTHSLTFNVPIPSSTNCPSG